MMKPIISAAVIVGLGIVGACLAQRPSTPTDPAHDTTNGYPGKRADDGSKASDKNPQDRAKLRAQVVKLQVEIEILQLQHDADREYLLELVRSARQVEVIPVALAKLGMPDAPRSIRVPRTDGEWMALERRAMMGDQQAHEVFVKFYEAGEKANKDGYDAGKAMEAVAKELSSKRAKDGDPLRHHIEQKREDYTRQATELAEKRLELAEIEKRYNETR